MRDDIHKSIRLVYLCLDGASPVVESQVIDHLRVLHEAQGPPCDLFIFGRGDVPATLSVFDIQRRVIIESSIGSRLHARLFRHVISGFFLTLIYLLRYTFPDCLTGRLVIHARAQDGGLLAGIFKWLCLGKPRIIYDIRGELLSEFEEKIKLSGSRLKKASLRFTLHIQRLIEWFNIKNASRILYVTNTLRIITESNFPFAKPKYAGRIPCLSDEDKLYIDLEQRKKTRKALGFHDRDIVLFYAGGLNWYQCVDEMLELFRILREKDKRICFLFLTLFQNHNEVKKRIEAFAPAEAFRILYANHSEIRQYLNAGDFGLLLRRPLRVNSCAAPTKFAEYILTGLPVIMTEGIGDYSALAQKEHLGIVIKNLDNLTEDAETILQEIDNFLKDEEKRRISDVGKRYLSRSKHIKDYIQLYDSFR